jgi:chlorite dismutase
VSDPDAAPPRDAFDTLNETVRYAVWAVFARSGAAVGDETAAAAEHRGWVERLDDHEVELRGQYDVSGMRAEADLMLWLHAPTAEALQGALRRFRRTAGGAATRLAWSAMGLHRQAEFSREHVPSFMQGKPPLRWLCVYPFVRSFEWYLLPAEERGAMLREHGLAGREFPQVQPNTVAAFALNDYEWILALESEEAHHLVDLMRDIRKTQARRHVRLETPFYTGRMVDDAELMEVLS